MAFQKDYLQPVSIKLQIKANEKWQIKVLAAKPDDLSLKCPGLAGSVERTDSYMCLDLHTFVPWHLHIQYAELINWPMNLSY